MKFFFNTQILFVCSFLLIFSACSKNEVIEDVTQEITTSEVDTREDEEPEIVPIELTGVEVRDGALAFVDFEAMDNAIETLSSVNHASRMAWEEEMGFTSILTEYIRIRQDLEEIYEHYDDIPENVRLEIEADEKVKFTVDGYPVLNNFSHAYGAITNGNGYFYVKEYVGTVQDQGSVYVGTANNINVLDVLENGISIHDPALGIYASLNTAEAGSFNGMCSFDNRVDFESEFVFDNSFGRRRVRGQWGVSLITDNRPANQSGKISINKDIEFRMRSWRRGLFGIWFGRDMAHTLNFNLVLRPTNPLEPLVSISNRMGCDPCGGKNIFVGNLLGFRQRWYSDIKDIGNNMTWESFHATATNDELNGNSAEFNCPG